MREVLSLVKGIEILEFLSNAETSVGNKEISEKLGIHKSSVSRFVQTLLSYGYVERDEMTGGYRLGPKIVRLSQKMLKGLPLRDHAKPFLRELVESTGECAHLAIHAQGQALCIDQVETNLGYQVSTEVGTLIPLHSTALGRVLLAFGDIPIPDHLVSITPRTITDPQILSIHLEKVRKQGAAIDDEENIIGVRCVAAPVFGLNDVLLGAIGISGPATRLTLDRIPKVTENVLRVSTTLSKRMRFEPE